MFETRIGPKDFLFICCDGIYESFSNEKAVEYVRGRLKKGETDSAAILGDLLTQVLQKGSKDNMTAMVPPLSSSYNPLIWFNYIFFLLGSRAERRQRLHPS